MKKTQAQKRKQLNCVRYLLESVCAHAISWEEVQDDIQAYVWISQYDLDKLLNLEAAGAARVCFHTHYGFKQPEEIGLPEGKHNPVYMKLSIR